MKDIIEIFASIVITALLLIIMLIGMVVIVFGGIYHVGTLIGELFYKKDRQI